MVKNLKVDPSSKLDDANLAPAMDRSPSDVTSCISSLGYATSGVKEIYVDQESLMAKEGMYYPDCSYYGYYYPGYDGSHGEWDDYGFFLRRDGLEIQNPAIQADNGLHMYYRPGFQPGYIPYSPYLPAGVTIGMDGQYLGQQPYFLSPISPQLITSPGYFPTPLPNGSEIISSYMWEPSLLVGAGAHGNGYCGVSTVPDSKPNFFVPSHTLPPLSKSMPSSKSSKPLEKKGSVPALDVSSGPGIFNQLKPVNKTATVLAKSYFPVTKFLSSNQEKGGSLYPNSPVNFKANGRGWGGAEKLKTRGKAGGVGDFDLLNEQNRGPRTNINKGALSSGVDPTGSLASKDNDNSNNSTTVIRSDQYNLPDFPTKYDHALFFVIKSYSEDNIHKSIKYNVWASTPNGNKRLDSAYQAAQERMGEKGSKCPVFLFFSVNASGQFCGVAEMIGHVDFNKNMDFWQQDKWNGFFPVKWHILKDVPNPQFRHIILENNDNKPVTNSRDTQEVRFPQGIDMLNIFKNYSLKASILDDFAFYEIRQKVMQDKRIRPPSLCLDLLQKPDEVQLTTGLQSIDLGTSKKKEE